MSDDTCDLLCLILSRAEALRTSRLSVEQLAVAVPAGIEANSISVLTWAASSAVEGSRPAS